MQISHMVSMKVHSRKRPCRSLAIDCLSLLRVNVLALTFLWAATRHKFRWVLLAYSCSLTRHVQMHTASDVAIAAHNHETP